MNTRPINEECPSDDFEKGMPQGKCWGDGHYMCENCKHFRHDFVGAEGFEKRDWLIRSQGAIQIMTIKDGNTNEEYNRHK